MSDIYLDTDEIKHITGKTQGAAQKRALEKMGYTVKDRPDGTFWVPRAQFNVEAVPANSEKKYKLNFGALKKDGKAA